MIKKSQFIWEIDRNKIEGIKDMNNDIFPSHFLCLICGRPGSGKTTLLKYLLKTNDCNNYNLISII